jgi:hypothetical protein
MTCILYFDLDFIIYWVSFVGGKMLENIDALEYQDY